MIGKWFNESLTDKGSIKDTRMKIQTWLNKVDSSGLLRKYNAWIYQHGTCACSLYIRMWSCQLKPKNEQWMVAWGDGVEFYYCLRQMNFIVLKSFQLHTCNVIPCRIWQMTELSVQGVAMTPFQQWSKALTMERHNMVQVEVWWTEEDHIWGRTT